MEPSDKRVTLLAPGEGASGGPIRLPQADDPLPRIDERLAPPETRVEYFHGAELYAAPADPPHAIEHCELSYVLRAHIAHGYTGAVDMLTRTGHATDFAPDASVFNSAPDPVTGGRQLEELAFEVTSEQALKVPTEKARELIRRGVRRVFCVLVAQRRVLEWSRETDTWSPLAESQLIEDRCLVRPIPVVALLDASAADGAAARALLDKRVPEIERALDAHKAQGKAEGKAEGRTEGKAEGRTEGKAELLLMQLALRFGTLPEAAQQRVRAASASDLDAFAQRVLTTASLEQVLGAG